MDFKVKRYNVMHERKQKLFILHGRHKVNCNAKRLRSMDLSDMECS